MLDKCSDNETGRAISSITVMLEAYSLLTVILLSLMHQFKSCFLAISNSAMSFVSLIIAPGVKFSAFIVETFVNLVGG